MSIPTTYSSEELPSNLRQAGEMEANRQLLAEERRNRVHTSALPLCMQQDIARIRRGDYGVIEEIGKR